MASTKDIFAILDTLTSLTDTITTANFNQAKLESLERKENAGIQAKFDYMKMRDDYTLKKGVTLDVLKNNEKNISDLMKELNTSYPSGMIPVKKRWVKPDEAEAKSELFTSIEDAVAKNIVHEDSGEPNDA